jgi:hypothetical protein
MLINIKAPVGYPIGALFVCIKTYHCEECSDVAIL